MATTDETTTAAALATDCFAVKPHHMSVARPASITAANAELTKTRKLRRDFIAMHNNARAVKHLGRGVFQVTATDFAIGGMCRDGGFAATRHMGAHWLVDTSHVGVRIV
jgi:hypothetical protein